MENFTSHSIQTLSSDEIKKIEKYRKAKKTAVLAILFSDIVDSTYATEYLGELTYSKLRHVHDELFIRIMTRDNAGLIIKEIGDSFLCVFAEPSAAVLRAIEFQRAIQINKENLTSGNYTITVKIGIHLGQVAVENSLALDIFGGHVNRAARIEALANGGQILTSHSIWENAVGWLKENNEKNIGWVAYGKTKLKGIEDKIEIYSFFPIESGKPLMPRYYRKQRKRKVFYFLSSIVLLLLFLLFAIIKLNHLRDSELACIRKVYYVQFNFSNLSRKTLMSDKLENFIADTLSLKEKLMAQAFNLFYPDSVVSESDLIESYEKDGRVFVRHNRSQYTYYRDTLNLSGTIFIDAKICNTEVKDSILLIFYIEKYPSARERILSVGDESVSLENIYYDFRNVLLEELMATKLATVQGFVLSYKDSIVLFRLNDGANLRKGISIIINRQYHGKQGSENWLADTQEEIDFYQNKPQYSEKLKEAIKKYNQIKMNTNLIRGGTSAELITGRGKVIELKNSIGKALFIRKGIMPWDVPRKGDQVIIAY